MRSYVLLLIVGLAQSQNHGGYYMASACVHE